MEIVDFNEKDFNEVELVGEHVHGSNCIGVDLRGVYDGVLFWICSDGVTRNRWSPGDYRYDLAEKHMKEWAERR